MTNQPKREKEISVSSKKSNQDQGSKENFKSFVSKKKDDDKNTSRLGVSTPRETSNSKNKKENSGFFCCFPNVN